MPPPDAPAVLSLDEAITTLLGEFELESFRAYFVDEARYDETFGGPPDQHPKVLRFEQVCAALKGTQPPTSPPGVTP